MNFLIHGRISTRLATGFGIILLIFAIVTALGVRSIQSLEIDTQRALKIRAAIDFRGSVHDRAIEIRDVVLLPRDQVPTAEIRSIEQLTAQYADAARRLDALMANASTEEREALNQIKQIETRTIPQIQQILKLRADEKFEEAQQFVLEASRSNFVAWLAAINRFINLQEDLSLRATEAAMSTARQTAWMMAGLCGVAILLGILIATAVSQSVVVPLREAREAVERIAQGDLRQPLHTNRQDEIGELLQDISEMQTSLQRMVTDIRESVSSVESVSQEISQGNQSLSQRTDQQAASLLETTASMDQLASAVRQSTENAQEANQLAAQAAAVAQQGGVVVNQVVSQMSEINQSSRKIAEIVAIIDSIAFQTNLLALNAAVEAARAGEQGKGFAVVASEVQSLAQRSSKAASEIKKLINDSVTKVASGSDLVNNAGHTMKEIVEQVQQVTALIGQISGATKEQNIGITQVSQAVGQLEKTTQQNLALVEQNQRSTESLTTEAGRLTEVVAVFQVHPSRSA